MVKKILSEVTTNVRTSLDYPQDSGFRNSCSEFKVETDTELSSI